MLGVGTNAAYPLGKQSNHLGCKSERLTDMAAYGTIPKEDIRTKLSDVDKQNQKLSRNLDTC